MDPTSLPEVSKPFRAQNFKEKIEKMEFQNFEKNSPESSLEKRRSREKRAEKLTGLFGPFKGL